MEVKPVSMGGTAQFEHSANLIERIKMLFQPMQYSVFQVSWFDVTSSYKTCGDKNFVFDLDYRVNPRRAAEAIAEDDNQIGLVIYALMLEGDER